MFKNTAANGKKKALLAEKERILQEIKYYEKRIKEFPTNNSCYYYDGNNSSDSEDNFPAVLDIGPSISELKHQDKLLRTCLQATQELTGVDVLQSEVNVMVQDPVLEGERPVNEPGSWKEVAAECRIDLVPFSITFYTHQPSRQFAPYSHRGLRVLPVKTPHEAELSKSVLSTLKNPSDAIQVLRSYAIAYRSRRTTLARLADRYANSLFMEPLPEGGFILKCANLLEMSWRLDNKVSAISPFRHRMNFELEYMNESYLKIIKQAHRQLSDPTLQTDERTQLLSKIISTVLEAQSPTQEMYESMESDPESIKKLEKTTLDEDSDEEPSEEQDRRRKDENIHKRKRDEDIMAPPKSIPKKSRPKGKENIDENRKAVKRSSQVDSNNAKKARIDGSDKNSVSENNVSEKNEAKKTSGKDTTNDRNSVTDLVNLKDKLSDKSKKTQKKNEKDTFAVDNDKIKSNPKQNNEKTVKQANTEKNDAKNNKNTKVNNDVADKKSEIDENKHVDDNTNPKNPEKTTTTKGNTNEPDKVSKNGEKANIVSTKNSKNTKNNEDKPILSINSNKETKNDANAKKSGNSDPIKSKKIINSDIAKAKKVISDVANVNSDSAKTKKVGNSDGAKKSSNTDPSKAKNNANSDPTKVKKNVNTEEAKKTTNSAPAKSKNNANSDTAKAKNNVNEETKKTANSGPAKSKNNVNTDTATAKNDVNTEKAKKSSNSDSATSKNNGNSDSVTAKKDINTEKAKKAANSDSATAKNSGNYDPAKAKNNVNPNKATKTNSDPTKAKKTVNTDEAQTINSDSDKTKNSDSAKAKKKLNTDEKSANSDRKAKKNENTDPAKTRHDVNIDPRNIHSETTKKSANSNIEKPSKENIATKNKDLTNTDKINKVKNLNNQKKSLTQNIIKNKTTANEKLPKNTEKSKIIIKNHRNSSENKIVKNSIVAKNLKVNEGRITKIPQKKLSPAYAAVLKQNPVRMSPRMMSKFKSSSETNIQSKLFKPVTNIPRLLKKPAPKSK